MIGDRPSPYDLGAQARDDARRRANPALHLAERLSERVVSLEGRVAKLESALAALDDEPMGLASRLKLGRDVRLDERQATEGSD